MRMGSCEVEHERWGIIESASMLRSVSKFL